MADDPKKPQPSSATSQKTPATQETAEGKAAAASFSATAFTWAYTPNPEIVTSTEWAQRSGPPVTPTPPFGYGSKRVDIHPRPPLDPSDFLNLQAGSADEFLPGLPGMLADKGPNNKLSAVPETDVPFGRFVMIGVSGDGYCRLADPAVVAAQPIIGIAMRDMTSAGGTINLFGPQVDGFLANQYAIPIIRSGRVWMLANTRVIVGQSVTCREGGTAGAQPVAGGTLVGGCRWRTSAPAGMLAILEVNIL